MPPYSLGMLANESDVEQKLLYPILAEPAFLEIPAEAIKTKSYLPPTELDKGAGKRSGYYPDYSIWLSGYPLMIVEAKDPTISADIGFREACLYARHLNARYPTSVNPCRYVIASNGVDFLAGYWDQERPEIRLSAQDIQIGTAETETLIAFCGIGVLEASCKAALASTKVERGVRPFNLVGGQALINSKLPLNTFAADLSPVLRRYFSSTNDDNIREIAERAYVSSEETTEYDRVLESILKDRSSPHSDTIVKSIHPSKNNEPVLTKAIADYSAGDHAGGQLQIIQGGVGSGKSLFARRYRDLLEPQALKSKNCWSFIDFNGSPPTLKGAEIWLCEKFVAGFEAENPTIDLYDSGVQKGIFSRLIQQRRAYYQQLRQISLADETRARAEDLARWQADPIQFSDGIANYVGGVIGQNLIAVMDNVDKLRLEDQLDAFQLALWFMQRSRAFVVLQMRDETYERFKNRPPLDTFRSGIAFHISPPRFVDVVKRRLELGIEYLVNHAPETQEYILDNGARVLLPTGELGDFLKSLYLYLFGRRNNVSRVLEALAGRDVRRALEMFVSIVISGHLSTSAITSTARGAGQIPISEYRILRILMRTDYRFFSDTSGYVTNIFGYNNEWLRPDNFLLVEVLYFLIKNRKRTGELGLEGYFSIERVADEIQKLGYDREDVFGAVAYLVERRLVGADHFNVTDLEWSECVKIQAAGFIHMRILCSRVEYLYGVIPVTPISDQKTARLLADLVNRENERGSASMSDALRAVEALLEFLKNEAKRLRENNPFFDPGHSGAMYVLDQMEQGIRQARKLELASRGGQNELDI